MTGTEYFLISYNVNGIRSAISKNFYDWLRVENPDIVCLQETKAQPGQIDHALFEQLGYHCAFHSAQRKGYSGTAILSKPTPDAVLYGIGDARFDDEGRLIRADYGDITLLCSYFPSGTMGNVRQAFKMEYLTAFFQYIEQLRQSRPKLIVTGDFNISHKPIDINSPKTHEKMSGFLPEERAWVDEFADAGFIDTFRVFHPDEAERYSWWSHWAKARERNIGWRLDYFWVTENLYENLSDADILDRVVHSDHCPVALRIRF
ncbi:MAG: exodeoxyribonuclease III [Prevotellaceae bacterium]|jgi:exodeoxyribonuclease-3|nr:exodeoxyribonuclease III [Prevotellaceae bacterium]